MPLTMLVPADLPAEVSDRLAAVGPDLHLLPFDETTWPAGAEAAEALLTWGLQPAVVVEALRRAPNVRWVQVHWAGVDHLLVPEIVERDLILCNAGGAHAVPIAEWALMLILAFAKRLPHFLDQQRRRIWRDTIHDEVNGKTVGIVGPGHIGRMVARRVRAVGMRAIAVRRRPEPLPDLDETLTSERLPELLARSDFLVCTAPLTPETRGMIGAAEIARLRPTAYLINLGRAAVVDQDALVAALRERRLAGAGLDVFETEPLPPDSPFWSLDNVIISPHCCDHTPYTDARAVDIILDNIHRYLGGQPLRNIVDKQAGY